MTLKLKIFLSFSFPLLAAILIFSAPKPALAAARVGNSPVTSLQTGLVGYWTFDGQNTNWTTGLTYDQSGNKNTGTLISMSTSTAPVAGKFGQALNFDGVNDYINIPDFYAGANMSVFAWINSRDVTQIKAIVNKRNDMTNAPGNGEEILFDTSAAGKLSVNLNTGGSATPFNNSTLTSNTTLSRNTWYHVGFVYNGSTVTIYLNGKSDGSASMSGTILNGAQPVHIGDDSSAARFWNGYIDDVRFYNRPLSVAEVQQLYKVGTAKFSNSPVTALQTNLLGYWTFDGQNTNWTTGLTYDQSGNKNTGTLINMSTSTTPAAGKFGQAFKFDAVDDYVNIPDIYANNMSIFAWINSRDISQIKALVNKRGGMTGGGFGEEILFNTTATGKLNIVLNTGASALAFNNGGLTSNTSLSRNTWYFVGFVYNGATETIYLNGKNDGSNSLTGTILNGTQPIHIGEEGSAGRFWNGYIDDVRIYNRALSAAEIQSLYQLGVAKFSNSPVTSMQTGLVGNWTFDGQHTNWTAGKTFDQSANKNTGTLTNMSSATAPTPGKFGQALKFDGVNDYVSVGTLTSLLPTLNSGSVTFSTWINTTYTAAMADIFGAVNSGVNTLFKVTLNRDKDDNYVAGKTQFALRQEGGNTLNAEISTTIYNGQWHHLTWIASPSTNTMNVYVDGIAVTATKNNSNNLTNFSDFGFAAVLGASNNRGSVENFFTGKLDDTRIYNRALSAAEVQQLYLMGK